MAESESGLYDPHKKYAENQALLVQRLCYEVYRTPCVWDKYSHENKCLRVIEAGWKSIAQRMGMPVALCQKRFRNLRDGYVKKRRKAGGVYYDKIYWGLSWYLRFLDGIQMTESDFGLTPEKTLNWPLQLEDSSKTNLNSDDVKQESRSSTNGDSNSGMPQNEDNSLDQDGMECITADAEPFPSIRQGPGSIYPEENDHCHSVAMAIASYLRMMPEEVRGQAEAKILSLCVSYAYNLPPPKSDS